MASKDLEKVLARASWERLSSQFLVWSTLSLKRLRALKVPSMEACARPTTSRCDWQGPFTKIQVSLASIMRQMHRSTRLSGQL